MSRTSGSVAMAWRCTVAAVVHRKKREPAPLELILDFVPECGALQSLFDFRWCLPCNGSNAGQRQRCWGYLWQMGFGLWNTMPIKAQHRHGIHGRMINIFATEAHMAFEPKAAYKVVHTVQATEHRALAHPDGPMKAVMAFFS